MTGDHLDQTSIANRECSRLEVVESNDALELPNRQQRNVSDIRLRPAGFADPSATCPGCEVICTGTWGW